MTLIVGRLKVDKERQLEQLESHYRRLKHNVNNRSTKKAKITVIAIVITVLSRLETVIVESRVHQVTDQVILDLETQVYGKIPKAQA
ncbi:hypothetical protein HC928_12475 [bacterium]|nr:hypothetical protein [bacterium]